MKVDSKFQSNYSGLIKNNSPRNNSNVGFTGSAKAVASMKDLLKQKKAIEFMEKLKWFDGEQGRIALTALGTGAIAPIFIAWNPYVKAKPGATEEEKKDMERTKKYTAMRQPISAVLQIAIQLSVLGPIFSFWDKMFNDPKYSKSKWLDVDRSAMNSKSYLTKQVKKAVKKEEKAGTLSFADKKARNKEIDKRVKNIMNSQINSVAEKLRKNGKIDISGRLIDDSKTARYLNSTIESYISDAEKLKIKDMTFYDKRAGDLCNNESEIKNLMNEAISKKGNIKEFLSGKLQSASNDDVKTILNEIINLSDDDARLSRCKRTIDRIKVIKDECGGTYDAAKYHSSMERRNSVLQSIIDKFSDAKIKNESEATSDFVKSTIKKLAKICQFDSNDKFVSRIFKHTDTFQTDAVKLLEKVAKDVTKSYNRSIDKRFKFLKEAWGISIGMLVTTPITCTSLNWVYPRFMELFMPNLVGKSKAPQAVKNGGDK